MPKMSIQHLKNLSERFTPTVGVASAVLSVTEDLATKCALQNKDKLMETAACTREKPNLNTQIMPFAQNFEIPQNFENLETLSGMTVNPLITSKLFYAVASKS